MVRGGIKTLCSRGWAGNISLGLRCFTCLLTMSIPKFIHVQFFLFMRDTRICNSLTYRYVLKKQHFGVEVAQFFAAFEAATK